jgi:hypothetical protein
MSNKLVAAVSWRPTVKVLANSKTGSGSSNSAFQKRTVYVKRLGGRMQVMPVC